LEYFKKGRILIYDNEKNLNGILGFFYYGFLRKDLLKELGGFYRSTGDYKIFYSIG
jgi:hypothetical protein